jgi:hypothetical protein
VATLRSKKDNPAAQRMNSAFRLAAVSVRKRCRYDSDSFSPFLSAMFTHARLRWFAPLAVALLVGAHLAWEFTHGGIARHHFLAQADMPAISNAWGLFALPLLAWLTVFFAQRNQRDVRGVLTRIAAGALIGALIAVLFSAKIHAPLPLMLLAAFSLAACFAGDRLESLLGFSLAMMITFGGILPLVIGGVILTAATVVRRCAWWVWRRWRS